MTIYMVKFGEENGRITCGHLVVYELLRVVGAPPTQGGENPGLLDCYSGTPVNRAEKPLNP